MDCLYGNPVDNESPEDYHPRARELLDDPFYWDCVNDFSPHGNDAGADLLEEYRDWLKVHREGQPLAFLKNLARAWGYSGIAGMDKEDRNESGVALAFAEIKLRGVCGTAVRDLALQSVERQRAEALMDEDWPHRAECLQALDQIEAKLRQF